MTNSTIDAVSNDRRQAAQQMRDSMLKIDKSLFAFQPRCVATWFGGDHDPDDNGETASGILTRGNPYVLGCALPVRRTHATPAPRWFGLPWGTEVLITLAGSDRTVSVPLIDIGPADRNPALAKIDLTVATFAALGIPIRAGRPVQGSVQVIFEVIQLDEFADWPKYLEFYRAQ